MKNNIFSYGIYDEMIQGDFYVRYPYRKIIFDVRTKFQQATLVDTIAFGRALFLDGILNSAETDECIYHEGLVHPAMVRSANRSRVLIIGGAEGGSLREVLRWLEVKHVDMVDIDEELVQLCRKHLSDVYGNSWSDERVNLHFIDGHTFLNQGLLYDVIILDLSEASEGSPAQKLFTREFYELVRSHLLPGGVVSVQSEWLYSQFHVNLTATQRAAFSAVQPMEVNIPSFLISEAFNLCVTDIAQLKRNPEEIDRIMEAGGVCGLHYYSGAIDKKMSTLPLYFLERYKNADKIFTDLTLPQIHNECCSTPIEPHKNRN